MTRVSSVPDTRVARLADGRDLAWFELGVADGLPVMAFHGTPGSRWHLTTADAQATAIGVRLIAPDRPGYGLSTYRPGRRLADWAGDVDRLADHLGLSRFAVVGISGGGPHAVACARFLPQRVPAVAIASGIAPLTEPGSEAGMGTDAVFVRLARRSPALVVPLLAATVTLERRWPERIFAWMERELSSSDAAVLRRPDVRAALLADFERLSRTTARTTAQEYGLFTRDWGFRLQDITVPVHLWHGDADRDVPASQARRLAELIPGAVLHEFPGEGHLIAISHFAEILESLTSKI